MTCLVAALPEAGMVGLHLLTFKSSTVASCLEDFRVCTILRRHYSRPLKIISRNILSLGFGNCKVTKPEI